jgi:uncharacterized protein (DUF433 family)
VCPGCDWRARDLPEDEVRLACLGAHDVFTALIVEQAGFETVFIGGFGTSARQCLERTVEAAGASGILLEDLVMPKRYGHFADKRVIPSEEMVLKIKAAVKAKSDPDFVIFARTDAFNSEQCGGRPCIRGMRIRVKDVLDLLAAGVSEKEILEDYPDLEAEDIKACLQYAAAQADHAVLKVP